MSTIDPAIQALIDITDSTVPLVAPQVYNSKARIFPGRLGAAAIAVLSSQGTTAGQSSQGSVAFIAASASTGSAASVAAGFVTASVGASASVGSVLGVSSASSIGSTVTNRASLSSRLACPSLSSQGSLVAIGIHPSKPSAGSVASVSSVASQAAITNPNSAGSVPGSASIASKAGYAETYLEEQP